MGVLEVVYIAADGDHRLDQQDAVAVLLGAVAEILEDGAFGLGALGLAHGLDTDARSRRDGR